MESHQHHNKTNNICSTNENGVGIVSEVQTEIQILQKSNEELQKDLQKKTIISEGLFLMLENTRSELSALRETVSNQENSMGSTYEGLARCESNPDDVLQMLLEIKAKDEKIKVLNEKNETLQTSLDKEIEKRFQLQEQVDILKANREEDNSCKRRSEDVQPDDVTEKRDKDQGEKCADNHYVMKDENKCEKKFESKNSNQSAVKGKPGYYERIEKLEKRWEARFEELKEFYDRNGHFKVPATYEGRDTSGLRNWIMNQTRLYGDSKSVSNPIKKRRLEKLCDIGFTTKKSK